MEGAQLLGTNQEYISIKTNLCSSIETQIAAGCSLRNLQDNWYTAYEHKSKYFH